MNGNPIGFKQAFMRSSVDLVFAVLVLTCRFVALVKIPGAEYSSMSWVEQQNAIYMLSPLAFTWIARAEDVWVWSEVVILLTNKKRRALHDFIAGTVVIHTPHESHLGILGRSQAYC
jgi:uncharacterized RDD family membrane protein YckC